MIRGKCLDDDNLQCDSGTDTQIMSSSSQLLQSHPRAVAIKYKSSSTFLAHEYALPFSFFFFRYTHTWSLDALPPTSVREIIV